MGQHYFKRKAFLLFVFSLAVISSSDAACTENYYTNIYDYSNGVPRGGTYEVTCEDETLPFVPFERRQFCEECRQILNIRSLNGTDSIPASAFEAVSYMNVLRLEKLGIKSIEAGAFENMGGLEEIHLSGNEIIEIKDGLLNNLKKLKVLDLSSTGIVHLNSVPLASLQSKVVLNLSHNAITDLTEDEYKSLSNVKEIDLSFNNLTKFNFGALNSHLGLNLSDNKLAELAGCPYSIAKLSLRNLGISSLQLDCEKPPYVTEFLDAGHNSISDVKILSDFHSLNHLNLQDNKIEALPENLFDKVKNLEFLDVSENNLKAIDAKLFAPLPNLTELHLQHNEIEVVPNSAFDVSTKLTNVDLSNNKIKEINSEIFAPLTALQHLNIQSNQLDKIPIGTFANNVNLMSLNISDNKISKMSCGTFENMYNLQTLDLSHNEIGGIKRCVFFSLTNMRDLYLNHNKLSKFSSKQLANIWSLNVHLDQNNLTCENLMEVMESTRNLPNGNTWFKENVRGNSCRDEEKEE